MGLELLVLESRGFSHLLRAYLLDGLREGPMVAIEIDGDVAAFAVELVGRLFGDDRTRLPGSRTMRIDAAIDAHEHALRVLAAQGCRTPGPIRPFVAYHHHAVAMRHLGVYDIIVRVGQYLADFEAKRFLQPGKGRAVVFVDYRRNEGGAGRCGGHIGLLIV